MNGSELLERMSDVEESLILESENSGKKRSRKKPIFIGLGAVAAAAAAAITVNFLGSASVKPPVNLPILNVDNNLIYGGFGFEGFHLTDISEYNNGNPWTADMDIKEMAVYKSNLDAPDKEKMTARLRSAAEKLGIDFDSMEVTEENFNVDEQLDSYKKRMEEQNVPADEIETELNRVKSLIMYNSSIEAENDMVRLSVDSDYCVGIHFRDDYRILLPEEYRDISTEEKKLNAAKYILERYGHLQDMKNPVIDIYYEDNIGFYDKGESDAETILNYSLNHSRYGIDEEGRLFVIWLFSTEGCEKIADYPIISAEEAEEELAKGNYLTTVPYELQGEKPVYTEITYRMDKGCDYALPFYRFLVELPEENEDGEKHFGAYYVLAVESRYVNDVSISFNGAPVGGLGLPK